MDNKNVFIAIALSMSVLLFWAAFFESPKPTNKINNENLQQQSSNENTITPNINENLKLKTVSRTESINSSDRIIIENKNIIGSMSLKGALIDDISFKNHKQNLKNNLNVEFLNPAETENGFYAETGWTSVANQIKVPSKKSIWKIKGNNILSDKKPIVLELIFLDYLDLLCTFIFLSKKIVLSKYQIRYRLLLV